MSFHQYAERCGEHGGCTAIVGVQDGRVVWRSHMADGVPPDIRLNVDHPDGEDRTGPAPRPMAWRLAAPEHLGHLGWDETERRHVGFLAAMSGRNPATLEGISVEIGVTAGDLAAEAVDNGWHDQAGFTEQAVAAAAGITPAALDAARAARRGR